MASLKLTVKMVGEPPVSVAVRPVSLVALERHYKKSTSELLFQESSIEAWSWLAWHALFASGDVVVSDYDDWLKKLEEAPTVENEDPTSEGQSPN